MSAPEHELGTLTVSGPPDVLAAGRCAREVAALLGLGPADRLRVATAFAELARELVAAGRAGQLRIELSGGADPALVLVAGWTGPDPAPASLAGTEGAATAALLLDTVAHDAGSGSVLLRYPLPAAVEPVTPEAAARLRHRCRGQGAALDGLRAQHRDVAEVLVGLRAGAEERQRVDAELEQTNLGVLALYTELDEITAELRAAGERKTRFWAGVSHELRTPLSSVLGLARLLLDPGSAPLTPDQREQVELIRDSGDTLLALVNDLLDVAKAESGQTEVRVQLVDLLALVGRQCAALRPALAPGVELVVQAPPEGLVVRTDPALVERVLSNLLSNAVAFTERGQVRCVVTGHGADGLVDIAVQDTGIGIAAEHQERVFEEFYQVPGPLQRARAGTGLGLPYARRVAEVLGGTLELRSEPGRGTTAVLRLSPTAAAPAPLRWRRVLVVEDDPGFLALARAALEPLAEQVVHAATGAEALRRLGTERPDLVLLDLNVAPPDGRELLARMRRDLGLRDVPVIVVTSAQLDAAEQAALGASAVVLDKARFSAALLPHVAADAAQLVGWAR